MVDFAKKARVNREASNTLQSILSRQNDTLEMWEEINKIDDMEVAKVVIKRLLEKFQRSECVKSRDLLKEKWDCYSTAKVATCDECCGFYRDCRELYKRSETVSGQSPKEECVRLSTEFREGYCDRQ